MAIAMAVVMTKNKHFWGINI